MISVEEARHIIMSKATTTESIHVSLSDATGNFLAAPVMSPHPLPLFDNSAMDGYALRYSDTTAAHEDKPVTLKVCGWVAAGDASLPTVNSFQAAQVFTGAQIASGADAVIQQEDVVVQNGSIIIKRAVAQGENIRHRGEEICQNQELAEQGVKLTPAILGLLTGAGVQEVEIHKPVRVALISTGSEVLEHGEILSPGKIYNSNAPTLKAALAATRAQLVIQRHVADDPDQIFTAMQQAFKECEVLLVTGGVSVGEHDYVKDAATRAGVETQLWKIKQKPGKPLFFGTAGPKALFGLPGNPASSLVCFYEYVYPYLLRRMGSNNPYLIASRAKLQSNFVKQSSLTLFLKGCFEANGTVQILEKQGSHMMSSFGKANCLAVIPEHITALQKGEEVVIHLLPQ